MRTVIYWTRKSRGNGFHSDICRRFGIPHHMSVNFETECEILDEDMNLLRECEKRGFLQIRFKKIKYGQ